MKQLFENHDVDTLRCGQMIDVTDDLLAMVARGEVSNGTALVYSPHTTCAVIINERENQFFGDFLPERTRAEKEKRIAGEAAPPRRMWISATSAVRGSQAKHRVTIFPEKGRLKPGQCLPLSDRQEQIDDVHAAGASDSGERPPRQHQGVPAGIAEPVG